MGLPSVWLSALQRVWFHLLSHDATCHLSVPQDVCVKLDRLGSVMEPELNCSSRCDSSLCFIHSGVNKQEGLDILQRLCGLSTVITRHVNMQRYIL